jgi:hypothetical protein
MHGNGGIGLWQRLEMEFEQSAGVRHAQLGQHGVVVESCAGPEFGADQWRLCQWPRGGHDQYNFNYRLPALSVATFKWPGAVP